MKTIKTTLSTSMGELKKLRSLTLASLLAAIYAVSYSPFAGNFVLIPGKLEIRFGFLAIMVAAMLFGPVISALVAVIGDVLGTLLFYGGSFMAGYTLSWAIMGLAFGFILYKNRTALPRIILAVAFQQIVVGMFITPYLHSLLGIGTFWALFAARIPLCAIMLPVNTVLSVLVLRGVHSVYQKIGWQA